MESLFNYGSDEDTQEKETEEQDANYDHVAMDMSSEDEEKSQETKLCSFSAVESSELSCSDSISCSSDGSHAATNIIKKRNLLDETNGSRKRKSNTEELGILSPSFSSSPNSKKIRYHSSHDVGDQRLSEGRNDRTINDRHHYNDNTHNEKTYHHSSSTKYNHFHSRRNSREWENERKYRPRSEENKSFNDEKSESRTNSMQNCAQLSNAQKLVGDHLVHVKQSTRDVKLPNNCNRNSSYSTKYADQFQKRKLLWSGEKQGACCENKADSKSNHWQDAKFSQDTDGKLRAKFKRLMGIKATEAEAHVGSPSSSSSNDLIKKQEEMFNSMEMQYEVARVSTHTHRGLGLGFGVHQFPR